METKNENIRYRVKGTWLKSNSILDWPVDTLGEAKAFIDGVNLADSSRIKDFKVIEIRDVVAVVSVHTKYKSGVKCEYDRDVCSHTSEEEAAQHLEHLKQDGFFNDDLDDYDWHYVTIKTEHEVSYD
jgi:hypothetical protein